MAGILHRHHQDAVTRQVGCRAAAGLSADTYTQLAVVCVCAGNREQAEARCMPATVRPPIMPCAGAEVALRVMDEHVRSFRGYAPAVEAHTRVTGRELTDLRKLQLLLVRLPVFDSAPQCVAV